MTCRELLKLQYLSKVNSTAVGGCEDCPSDYGYLADPNYCPRLHGGITNDEICGKCWDREIVKEGTSNTFQDNLIQKIKEIGKELIDRAKDIVPENADFVNNISISINIPSTTDRFNMPTLEWNVETVSKNIIKIMMEED